MTGRTQSSAISRYFQLESWDVAVAGVGAAVALAVAAAIFAPSSALACPFCSAVQMTLTQELDQADVSVIAQLIEPMPDLPSATDRFSSGQLSEDRAKFRIVQKLRGADKLEGVEAIEVVYFGDDGPDKRFLINGIADGQLDWTTPLPLSDRAVEYVQRLDSVPESGADRLVFFQEFLEDEDPLLAQDSYDEFARAPYEEVIDLGPRMHREQLLQWISDPDVGPSGRRLYLTMLGVCGQKEDIAELEEMIHFDHTKMQPGIAAAVAMSQLVGSSYAAGSLDELVKSEERRKKESLDALLACYLTLKGPSGLDLVNEQFLGNPDVEYKYMHSAIMALRFHASETEVLPRDDLIASMRLALDHPDFADQIVPDLAQWEDWDVMPRLIQMFKDSSEDDWIRRPVASFLLVASEQPGEVGSQAATALDELEQLDPKTIEAVRSLSAFGLLTTGASASSSGSSTDKSLAGAEQQQEQAAVAVNQDDPAIQSDPTGQDADPKVVEASGDLREVAAEEATVSATLADEDSGNDLAGAASTATASDRVAAETQPPSIAEAPANAPAATPNRLALVGVPLLAALVLFAVFAALLRGGDSHSPTQTP